MTTFSIAALVLVLSALLRNVVALHDNYAAARCCQIGIECPAIYAYDSGHCFTNRWMSQQPQLCQEAACNFCKKGNRRTEVELCSSAPILRNCFPSSLNTPPPLPPTPKPRVTPAPTRTPPPTPSGQCVWTGTNHKLVIPLSSVPIASPWTRNHNAITWKRDGGSGTDPAGSGSICMRMTVPKDGTYYLTATSSAPHPTEHNDAWFKFSAGLDLYRPVSGSFKTGNSGWYKGYQNDGRNKKANYINTIDFNGHQFITKNLRARDVYSVCISGRSSRYTLYELVFVHCTGRDGCSRFAPNIKAAMSNLTPSKCT